MLPGAATLPKAAKGWLTGLLSAGCGWLIARAGTSPPSDVRHGTGESPSLEVSVCSHDTQQ